MKGWNVNNIQLFQVWRFPTGPECALQEVGCRARRLRAYKLLGTMKVTVVGVGVASWDEHNCWTKMVETKVREWRRRCAKRLVCFRTLEKSLSGTRGDWLQVVCLRSSSCRCRCFPGDPRGKLLRWNDRTFALINKLLHNVNHFMMSRNGLFLNDLTSPHDTYYFERGREKGGLRGASVVTYFILFFSNVAIQAYYDKHEPLKGHGEYRLINSSKKVAI